MGVVTPATNKFLACIDACSKCTQACYECFTACLNEPDLNARKNCVSILVECAMMCQMSVAMMSMTGQFAKQHYKCALRFSTNALRSVRCLKIPTARNVRIFAVNAQMSAGKWPACEDDAPYYYGEALLR